MEHENLLGSITPGAVGKTTTTVLIPLAHGTKCPPLPSRFPSAIELAYTLEKLTGYDLTIIDTVGRIDRP